MATIYNYFHLGEQTLYLDNLTLHPPTLLTFSKIKNGMKGETNLHLHSYLELFYFESGKGFFEIDNKVYPLQADKLLIVDAKKLHLQYSDSRKRPLTYYNFSIDHLHLKNKPANSITSGGFFIYTFPSKQNKIRANIIRLMNEFENKQYNYNNKIYAIFTEILIDTLRLVLHDDDFSEKNEDSNVNRRFLEGAKEYIEEHYKDPLSLEELLKQSFMAKSYFVTQFKKLFNISPMQYLTLVRVEKAKLLLQNTDDSVTLIASETGFNSPVYFAEVFSKLVGVSPSNYRKIATTDL